MCEEKLINTYCFSGANGWQRQTIMAMFCFGPTFPSPGGDRDGTSTTAQCVWWLRNGIHRFKWTQCWRMCEEDNPTQGKTGSFACKPALSSLSSYKTFTKAQDEMERICIQMLFFHEATKLRFCDFVTIFILLHHFTSSSASIQLVFWWWRLMHLMCWNLWNVNVMWKQKKCLIVLCRGNWIEKVCTVLSKLNGSSVMAGVFHQNSWMGINWRRWCVYPKTTDWADLQTVNCLASRWQKGGVSSAVPDHLHRNFSPKFPCFFFVRLHLCFSINQSIFVHKISLDGNNFKFCVANRNW